MTLPINGLTRITGFESPTGTGPRAALRKSRIEGYVIREWSVPNLDEFGNAMSWTAGRFAVMAVGQAGTAQVRVADFATQAEADTYVTNDALGLLS